MKNNSLNLSLLLAFSPAIIFAAAGPASSQGGGALNAAWFYDATHPYAQANAEQQERNWKKAAALYYNTLNPGLLSRLSQTVGLTENPKGTEYDQHMARLNYAACLTAQGLSSEDWQSFDTLCGIPTEKQLPVLLDAVKEKDSILVLSNVGIGDRVHFLETVRELKKRTGANITLSVPEKLISLFDTPAQEYGFSLISDKAAQPETTYQTYMVGLLGHLEMPFAALSPERTPYHTDEATIARVEAAIAPLHAEGKNICCVIAGENRSATLIGGKQLPRDPEAHGRQITPAAFERIMTEDPNLVILDCGTKDSKVTLSDALQSRVKDMPAEEEGKAFDTFVALGALINSGKYRMMVVGADQGPTNVLLRAIDHEAQQRDAVVIIPNPGEYDMRMEGAGAVYQQSLSGATVYKSASASLEDQSAVLSQALNDWKRRRALA